MGRPSMVAQRREEILNALEICIRERGIGGTSLEYLAEIAKMKRSILRHYIGNRDEIIVALGERWAQYYAELWQSTLDYLPSTHRVESLIEVLFSPRDKEYIEHVVIGEALFSEAKRLEKIKQQMQQNMQHFLQVLKQEMTSQFPNADGEKCQIIAHGIHANYLMAESLLPLDMQDDVYQLKQSSLLLLSTIK